MTGDHRIQAAAVALLNGWSPASAGFLDLQDEDLSVMWHVIQRAHTLRHEEIKATAEAIGIHVGNRVALLLAQALR